MSFVSPLEAVVARTSHRRVAMSSASYAALAKWSRSADVAPLVRGEMCEGSWALVRYSNEGLDWILLFLFKFKELLSHLPLDKCDLRDTGTPQELGVRISRRMRNEKYLF